MTEEERIHIKKSKASSVNGAGKTGQLYSKNQSGLFSYSVDKNQLIMDQRLKFKI